MREVIGVVRGGPSNEYEISLKSGASILESLNTEKYDARDIFIDRSGEWHMYGSPVSPEKALQGVDVVFNALHGEYGEDGKLQRMLDQLAVPYTGSGAMASSLAFHKQRTNEAVKKLGIKVPHSIFLEPEGDIEDIAFNTFRTFPHPAIVKPVVGGSSVGITLATSFQSLQEGLRHAASVSPKIMVEEFIKGREATVGVIDGFRGEDTYALMPVEIIPPPSQPFFNYEAKYSGESTERVPAHFSQEEKKVLMDAARKVHEGLELSHYSRSDFIVSPRGVYFLEVNTLPGLTKESLLPKALSAVGTKLSDFLDHIIALAKRKRE